MIEWKEIDTFDGLFSVSSIGQIKNNKTNRILKPTINPTGYYFVIVRPYGRNGGCKAFRVHREVAKAFIPNEENKPTVNHIDGDKLNNSVKNLEWATHKEQVIHAHANNLTNPPKGSNCKLSRLTDEQVTEILDNPHIRNIDFARRFNIDRSAISKVRSGKNWKHLSKVATGR